jgi:hypothetical protein
VGLLNSKTQVTGQHAYLKLGHDHFLQLNFQFSTYKWSGDFVSVLQDLIYEVIPSHRYQLKMTVIINDYGTKAKKERGYRFTSTVTESHILVDT